MNHLANFLLISVLIAAASAFSVHTPLNGVSNGSGMTMRARECDLLGKRPNRQARVVTFSHKRNKKVQHVNLQRRSFFSEDLGRTVKLRLSTKGLKTVEKYGGIDAAAKKFGVDLKKF